MRFVVAPLWALLVGGMLVARPVTAPDPGSSHPLSDPTTAYTRLYVFGDSYSDIGAGYIDGNGPTAVAYLGWLMGLQVASSKTAHGGDRSLVFAVSGAGTGAGEGTRVKEALLGYGMLNQVRDFATRVKSGDITFDPRTTLFFVAGGLNDGRLQTEQTIENFRRLIETIHDLGGRHVTVARLPTKIPQFAAVSLRLNPAIQSFVDRNGKSLGVELWMNNWGNGFDDVMEHPAAYGITNTTDACAGRALFDQDPSPAGDPATFFFYHEGHPSTAVHRVVGGKLFEEIRTHQPRLVAIGRQ
jgi:cholinesterase